MPGSRRQTVSEVTLDSSYLEGGEPLTPKELGLTSVAWCFCNILTGSESETVEVGWAKYNISKELLEVFNYKTQKQIASTKNLEKVVIQVVAHGI